MAKVYNCREYTVRWFLDSDAWPSFDFAVIRDIRVDDITDIKDMGLDANGKRIVRINDDARLYVFDTDVVSCFSRDTSWQGNAT